MDTRQQDHEQPEGAQPDERHRWVTGRRTITLLAVAAVTVAGVQLAHSPAPAASSAPIPVAAGMGVLQPVAASPASVALGDPHVTRRTSGDCVQPLSQRTVTASLNPGLTTAQLQTVLQRLQDRVDRRQNQNVTNLRLVGKQITGTITADGATRCGARRLQSSGFLVGIAAEVAATAVFIGVTVTLLTLGAAAATNPASAAFSAYYLAFTGCAAGAAGSAVRNAILKVPTSSALGQTLTSCLAGAVISAGVGKLLPDAARVVGQRLREAVTATRIEVPERVASATTSARSSAGTELSNRAIQVIVQPGLGGGAN